jgi:hypothetical protein
MRHRLPLMLGLLMAPAVAQRDGSINANAPFLRQMFTSGTTRIALAYTSLAWGQGAIVAKATDKGGYDTRRTINDLAKTRPAGTFATSVDLTCGDLKIPAGEYALAFTINDNCEWQISLTDKVTLTMKLPLHDNKERPSPMLVCSLYAGEQGSACCYVAFGDKACVLTFKPAEGPTPAGGKKGG